MQHLKIYFLFASAVFRCSSNDIALKGLFLHHCVVFSFFCVAIVSSERSFARANLGLILPLSDGKSLQLVIFCLK